MGVGQRFEVPEGWVVRGYRFEVRANQPLTSPDGSRRASVRRGFAYNRALAQAKANLEARKANPAIASLAWNFYVLRRARNQAKHQVAP